jgi:Tol biopolymer transport system component
MRTRLQLFTSLVLPSCLAAIAGCERFQSPAEPVANPTLDVREQRKRVVVTPSRAVVDVEEQFPLTAVVLGENGRPIPGASVTWTSESPRVATVNERGVVTGIAPGSTVVTAASGGAASAQVSIFVVKRAIAFAGVTDDVNIFTISGTGTNLKQLTSMPIADLPIWSPDGGKILFVGLTGASSPYQVFVVNADGSGQSQLTNAATNAFRQDWSPDASRILLDYASQLWLMNADGSNWVQLTSGFDSQADWSQDGTKIVFLRHEGDQNGEVYSMNADGTGQTKLTTTPPEDRSPEWSPDGTKIGFTSGNDAYVMNADGSGLTNITGPDEGFFYDWAPDGSSILYGATTGGGGLFVMSLTGGGVTKIAGGNVGEADWSPDGEKIVFVRFGLDSLESDLYVVRPNGTGETLILGGSLGISEPTWRP